MVDQVSTITDGPAASSAVEESGPGNEVTLIGTVEGDTQNPPEEAITTEGEGQLTEGEKEETVQAEEEGKEGETELCDIRGNTG